MKYVQIATIDPVIDHVVEVLSDHLRSGEQVAWLLSGGSAIDLEVRIAQRLQTLDVTKLYVGLIDERYGPRSHKDENYVQLTEAFFPFYINRVLKGESGAKTAKAFGEKTMEALKDADFSLGIFGIGADGHTAGIKPGSPAVTSTEPAVFYKWDDYQRITLTPPIIRELDEAIVYAVGHEKTETLQTLTSKKVSPSKQPAQVLKDVAVCTLYTDCLLGSAK